MKTRTTTPQTLILLAFLVLLLVSLAAVLWTNLTGPDYQTWLAGLIWTGL